jgi:2-polyprenyl-3-methyl-5-hydroxy-6-metoxy-1,4-benzoquinol methylase
MQTTTERDSAHGENWQLTPVDRLGVWLSGAAVRRHADFEGARMADFGCGYEATLARTLLEKVRSAVLLDVSLAPDLGRIDKVTAIEGRLPEDIAELESRSLDVILCLSVLEHLERPQETLDEFFRLLDDGGKLLVNVPSWRGKPFLETAIFRLGLGPADALNQHRRYYDPRDLWPMLVQAGFQGREIRCRRHKLGLNTFAVCEKPDGAAR